MRRAAGLRSAGVAPRPAPPPSPMPSAIFGVPLPSLGAAGTCSAESRLAASGATGEAPPACMGLLRENFMVGSPGGIYYQVGEAVRTAPCRRLAYEEAFGVAGGRRHPH